MTRDWRQEFVNLFTAVAACEAPEGTQVDEVLGDFQDAFDETLPDATCIHCGRRIVNDPKDGWVDLEAGRDVENGDGIWRETCDANEAFTAEHEPGYAPSAGKYEGLWVMENQAGLRWSVRGDGWKAPESNEFTSWTDTELEELEGIDSDHLDTLLIKYEMPATGKWVNINEA